MPGAPARYAPAAARKFSTTQAINALRVSDLLLFSFGRVHCGGDPIKVFGRQRHGIRIQSVLDSFHSKKPISDHMKGIAILRLMPSTLRCK